MNMGQMGWVAWLIVGAVAGWLASKVMRTGQGLVTDILVGIVGAFIGGFLFNQFGGLERPTAHADAEHLKFGRHGASPFRADRIASLKSSDMPTPSNHNDFTRPRGQEYAVWVSHQDCLQ